MSELFRDHIEKLTATCPYCGKELVKESPILHIRRCPLAPVEELGTIGNWQFFCIKDENFKGN